MGSLSKSPWVIHYDGSSCNGCDIEVLASLMPRFDVERFGVINTGNPKHADILLITGSINDKNKEVVQNIFTQMPDPKVVIAVGICATSGGIFRECYNVLGGVDKILPVDVYVPGCAIRPQALIDGVVKAVAILEKKRHSFKQMVDGLAFLTIDEAAIADAVAILELQKMAYKSEAELYSDYSIAPLRQTVEELKTDFNDKTFLKAVLGDVIVGSVRASQEGEKCTIRRLVVHPQYQNFGIGRKLMEAIEQRFSSCKVFEIFTGHKSRRNIYFYQKQGYQIVRSEKATEVRTRVYLEKTKEKEYDDIAEH